MKIEAITNQAVEQFLKHSITTSDSDSILLDLSFLMQYHGMSVAERKMVFFDKLQQVAVVNYQKYRKDENLNEPQPIYKDDAVKILQGDFRLGNPKLESCSALYYRYFSQIEFSIEDLSKAANIVPQQFRRRLNEGLSMLVLELRKLEMQANESTHAPDLNVPLPEYSTLVGAESLLKQLENMVTNQLAGQITSVEGMGGIGKTALVHALVHRNSIKRNYHEVLWVSARQPGLSVDSKHRRGDEPNFTLEDVSVRLAQQLGLNHLADKPIEDRLMGIQAATGFQKYLLVVDNLETIEDYSQLVPAIARYCKNCKILITTRESLREYPYVDVFQVPELDEIHAAQLLESEVSRRGQNLHISNSEIEGLFETVGGLPLAIKLVAAQAHFQPMADLVLEFKQAKNGIESIYKFLYWKIWNSLNNNARQLLFTFLSVNPEGEDSGFLSMMSGQSPDIFIRSFADLDGFSLIETNWFDESLKFRIHRLTATFLQTDILKIWDSEKSGE